VKVLAITKFMISVISAKRTLCQQKNEKIIAKFSSTAEQLLSLFRQKAKSAAAAAVTIGVEFGHFGQGCHDFQEVRHLALSHFSK